VGIGVVLGAAAVPVVEPRLPTSPVVRGLEVGGRPLPAGVDPAAWLRTERRRLAKRRVVLQYEDLRYDGTLGDLGIELDVTETLRRATEVGHTGSVFRRLRQTARAREGAVDVELAWRIDEDQARLYVERFADDLARDPQDAELDLAGHRTIPDVNGRALDVDATIRELREHGATDEPFNLVTRVVPAAVTVHDLENIDVSKLLSTFETRFRTYKKGRSKNVVLATSKLNGLIIRPGATISFNKRVGPRTLDRGFQYAPEIVGDELTVGVGGGTCQVSSTLHGAAVYGGLEVVDRKSHSRPSDYTKLGLDATVAYPRVDLKIRNPHDFTIAVHAHVPEPGLLRVELLGGDVIDTVEYKYGVARIEQYVRRITVRRFLKEGRVVKRQKGTRGMDVFSWVTVRFKDGRENKLSYFSGYRPTPEVFWVAPDYDPGELPDLPKWAKGVEGRLHSDGSDVYPTL
jgi:vancomycin resistance protein YoaR